MQVMEYFTYVTMLHPNSNSISVHLTDFYCYYFHWNMIFDNRIANIIQIFILHHNAVKQILKTLSKFLEFFLAVFGLNIFFVLSVLMTDMKIMLWRKCRRKDVRVWVGGNMFKRYRINCLFCYISGFLFTYSCVCLIFLFLFWCRLGFWHEMDVPIWLTHLMKE